MYGTRFSIDARITRILSTDDHLVKDANIVRRQGSPSDLIIILFE